MELRQHQKDVIKFAMENKFMGTLLWHDMGLGKAQPISCLVATPDGFKKLGDIKEGDEVLSVDGLPTKVTGVYPQGRKEIFKCTFSDGSTTRSCADHLWQVVTPTQKARGSLGKVMPLKDFKDALHRKNGNSKWFIPVAKPCHFSSQKYVIPPYTLGVLIGDGSLTGQGVGFTKALKDNHIVERVRKELPDTLEVRSSADKNTTKHYIARKKSTGFNVYYKELDRLKLLTKSNAKHIPNEYLYGALEDRIAFLQGLMDTDGHVSEDGMTIEYCTSSPQLASDFRVLIQSLGGTTQLRPRITNFNTEAFRGTVVLPSEVEAFSLARKKNRLTRRTKYFPRRSFRKVEMEGEEDCVCISVTHPSRLYLTDEFIVTHNTVSALTIARDIIRKTDNPALFTARILVICPKSLVANWKTECHKFYPDMLTRLVFLPYSQLKRGKNLALYYGFRCIIFDESHFLKSPETERILELAELLKHIDSSITGFRNGKILMLSGTPMPNSAAELYTTWAALTSPTLTAAADKIIDQDAYETWKKTFCIKKENTWYEGRGKQNKKKGSEWEGSANEDKLTKLLSPIVHFRRMEDCLDLPDKQEISIDLGLPDDKLLRDADIEKPEAYMALVERLARAKTPHMIEWIKDFIKGTHQQLIVFSTYRFPLIELQEKVKGVGLLTGAESTAERDQAVKAFQDGHLRILATTYKAGGIGLNLQNAAISLYHGYPWTPGDVAQAIARTHRGGQTKKTLHYFFLSGQNDARILRLIRKKEEAITSVEACLDNGSLGVDKFI